MTTLSVAMATYNGARFLPEQLDSLLAQTRQPDELVVADDGSTDATLAILEAFATRARFPVHIHRNGRQRGYRDNFLQCAGLCTGDLIAFSDQDDVWLPGKLETQAKRLLDPGVLLSCHNVLLVDSHGESLDRTFRQCEMAPRFTFADGLPFCYSIGFTLVFRRRLLGFGDLWPGSIDENAPEHRMAHDQWFSFLASVLGTITYEPEVLAHYRQHDRNTSGPRDLAPPSGRDPDLLLKRREEYGRLAVAARNRTDLITAMLDRTETTEASDRSKMMQARARYQALRETLCRRRDLYNSPSALRGALRLLGSLCRGDYRLGSRWHFTPRNAVRDLLLLGEMRTRTTI